MGPHADSALAQLCALLTNKEFRGYVRAGEAEAIGKIGPDKAIAVAALRNASTDTNTEVAEAAAKVLARLQAGSTNGMQKVRHGAVFGFLGISRFHLLTSPLGASTL